MNKVKVKANANIALVKYWGKKDETLIIPYNGSISLTLKEFYTITEVEKINEDHDQFYLDGSLQDEKETKRISNFIDLFRQKSNNNQKVRIFSKNYFPTAAGLASSASGYAALAGALNSLYELKLSKKDLSKMARKGSGSASRSIFGGLVEWVAGEDDDSSYAKKIDDASWDIGMIAVILNDKKKQVSSRYGMSQTVKTCPFYKDWVESTKDDLLHMKDAIKNIDLRKIGEIAESSALKMHATMMATKPPVIYFEEKTISVIKLVAQMREEGILAYFTMDAGPNVKIITNSKYKDIIIKRLTEIVSKDHIIYSEVGNDLEILEEN